VISRQKLALRLLQVLAVYGLVVAGVCGLLVFVGERDPDKRAIVGMGMGLIVFWCLAGGAAMFVLRDRLVGWLRRIPLGWRVRFVVLCIVLALLEEAVTTSLTNAAPLFGAATEAARITRSKNYLEVIRHSVLVFVPWFLCWAWLLGRWDFKPLEVMLLFGLTGTLAETFTFGPANLPGVGMWTWVYGLMVYLPACTVPPDRPARPARWWVWLPAVFLPLVFILVLPVLIVIWLVRRIASRMTRQGGNSPAPAVPSSIDLGVDSSDGPVHRQEEAGESRSGSPGRPTARDH